MRMHSTISTVISGGALVLGSSTVTAQTFGVEYTTEWQTAGDDRYDWLNLLKTSAVVPVSTSIGFEATTISTAKTGDSVLHEDMLTYSNIEAGNIPLTLARLGFSLKAGDTRLFAGINNVNEDYFTSELTSFFTNSSCGIFPTISCNYDIANYPLASWCVHLCRRTGSLEWQTSLYPGRGYSRLLGHDNLFGLDPGRDGIFSISSIDYRRNDLYCVMGVALHYGVCMGDEDGEQVSAQAPAPGKRFTAAPWILTEYTTPGGLGLLTQVSVATVADGCRWYTGAGVVYSGWRVQPGAHLGYASFTGTDEYDLELTARLPLCDGTAYLQPALHVIGTGGHRPQCVGLLRLNIGI